MSTTVPMSAESIGFTSGDGTELEGYLATPTTADSCGGVIVIHHMPGYDEESKEIARRFAAHGYQALCPNLYTREGIGLDPDVAATQTREKGGVPDVQVVEDIRGALEFLRARPQSNGKVAAIGYCSGGRQSFLVACSLPLDAAIDCYGACVVNEPPAGMPIKLSPLTHLAPTLACPLLGLFGEEDVMPAPAETAALGAILDNAGKSWEFHTYPNAGHAFFAVNRPNFRPEASLEGWKEIWTFLGKHL